MDPRESLLGVYRELADWYEKRRQPPMRDRFLVLAADAALLANRPDEAESLRLRLLRVNPHHMLKPYASLNQALKAPDVLTYIKDLRVNYPANVAEDLLRTVQAEDKRPPGPIPAGSASVGATAAVPVVSDEMFLNPAQGPRDLAPTADPGALPTPYDLAPASPDSRPQTLPLQSPNPNRPRSPRQEPVRGRAPVAVPFPLAAVAAPVRAAAESSSEGGSWLAVLLFLVVLASGAALAAFTVLRPYISQ